MGTVAEKELMKWEKMQVTCANEEKILVLVRLRPLNEKEIAVNEIADWECINDTTILYRNSLREGSTFPNAYTFDRVFRGDCSTKQVYEEGAREIALSAVRGINSSIFAYGQTSSGKTYTMNGITEYTVADIFDYIHRHGERAFVLKFSAIEIYNEAVRDLLSEDSTPLRLLDDPERGTVVERVKEETLRDWNHLNGLLSVCEAQRQIGETSLNEKSSRSHQIVRLTIESSAREFLGKDNSTTLAASVNFVDLAGSERSSQASSAGARLKEGCHINRSLLTLGTVIRKLSKGRHGHINYRDSKLTRILQPCLGGNARTAIICTLSPVRSHVEQSRNALLFACCAKEVTTKAQVNIVMSDKALVKHLQKELARLESELRSPVPVSSTCDYAALLRKKDLQIEKMEKEIRELIQQRDVAQSRVEDLLRMVEHDQESRQTTEDNCNKWRRKNMVEEEHSASESSTIFDSRSLDVDIKKFSNPHFYNGDSESNPEDTYHQLHKNIKDNSLSDGTTSPLPDLIHFVRSDRTVVVSPDDSDDCKEVQCIEMDESCGDKTSKSLENVGNLALNVSRNGNNIGTDIMLTPSSRNREVSQMQICFTNSEFENSNSHKKLTRSWSCGVDLMTGSSSPEKTENTPPHGFEKLFPGRPDEFERKFPPPSARLLRFDSPSSMGSARGIKTSADVEITSLGTFESELKEMTKVECGKQPVNDDGQEIGPETKFSKNMEDVGVNPMGGELESPPYWQEEFERQQRMILELWETCNVSLVHRTYFFLLFRGDLTDSIYMEVELRRLTYLKETFSHANQAMEGGGTLTPASSTKALRRERVMLSRLMQKRFSEEERKKIFQKWGIELNSKRRRLQLANLLWSKSSDMNHISESAAIVSKLVKFVEAGHALKGMFGLSFTPPQLKCSSYVWKNSMVYFL